jgi:hypothetical protein
MRRVLFEFAIPPEYVLEEGFGETTGPLQVAEVIRINIFDLRLPAKQAGFSANQERLGV